MTPPVIQYQTRGTHSRIIDFQGISGMQPGTVDPLEKVLALIPPPPAKDSDTEPEDPDTDWDD